MPGGVNWSKADIEARNRALALPPGGPVAAPPALPASTGRQVYRSKTEAARAQALDLLMRAGEIRAWQYEPMSLRLPGGVRYVSDFLVVVRDGSVEFEEIKGRKGLTFYSRPISKMKIAIAAEIFPWWQFSVIWPGERLGTWERYDFPRGRA